MGDKEVHGNVLTVDVFIHHISDSLRHHIRIQVGIILSGKKKNHTLLEATQFLGSQQKYSCISELLESEEEGVGCGRHWHLGSWSQGC